jgi:hypothetical protein
VLTLSGGVKLALTVAAAAIIVLLATVAVKRFAPGQDDLPALVFSAVALAISLVSIFKEHLFAFRLRVIPGEITFAVPTARSHRSVAIILSVSFLNEGYGQGVVEWVAIKIKQGNSVKLYTPIAEIDYEKFIQGRRRLHAENIRGGFSAFVLHSREATRKHILLTQEEDDPKYPFNEWQPGKYEFEIYVKSSESRRPILIATKRYDVSDELLKKYFSGVGAVLMDRRIDI